MCAEKFARKYSRSQQANKARVPHSEYFTGTTVGQSIQEHFWPVILT